MKKIVKGVGVVIAGLIALIVGYGIFMQINGYRIADFQSVETVNSPPARLDADQEYTLMTYNLGFGAYSVDYFFYGYWKDERRESDAGKAWPGFKQGSGDCEYAGQARSDPTIIAGFYILAGSRCEFHMKQLALLNQVLIRSGREEQATMTSLAGLVVVLMIVVQRIAELFDLVKTLFRF